MTAKFKQVIFGGYLFSIPQSSICNYAKMLHIFNALQKSRRKEIVNV